MSDKIDKRIVEMSFENAKFEKGIAKSKNSLTDFSKALEKTTKHDDFSGLDKSIGNVSNSFSVFREIGIGALRRIGEEAVTVGANMIKSLAVEPITQGFSEMELKMNSTQTIMASTGESLAVVNKYLEELNTYSDRTIYSFSDMTQNIGKFTNAGVKLELAVASIKGVSNAAALAGANAQEASRAMYNFAQALSAGYVKLIDWKSIENANMATVGFKTQLLEAGVAAGTVTKTADGMYKVLTGNMAGKKMEQTISATRNFNEALSFQWMTTEVLTNTLAEYADETTEIGKKAMEAATQVTTFSKLMDTLKESVGSGWAQTFELIFGDFNESKKLWTGINDALGEMIGTISDARNALLSGGMASGWKQFMKKGISDTETFGQELANVAEKYGVEIDKIITDTGSMEQAVKKGWLTGNMLTETVENLASKIENLSDEELNNAGYTAKNRKELLALRDALESGAISADEFAKKMSNMSGRENIIEALKNTVVALLKVLKPVSEAFDQIFPPLTVDRFYSMTESFKEFTKQLIISEEIAQKIKRTFAGLFAVIDIGWQIVRFFSASVMEIIKVFIPFGDDILGATATLGDFLVMINKAIKSSGFFQYALLAVRIAAMLIKEGIITLAATILTFVDALWNAEDPLGMIRDLGINAFNSIKNGIKSVLKWIGGKFTKGFISAQELISNLFGPKVLSVFSSVWGFLKTIGETIIGFVTPGFKGMGDAISKIDFSKMTKFVVGGVLLLLVIQISRFTGAATKFVTAGKKLLTTLNSVVKGPKPNVLKDLAIAVGVLAASIWVISKIPADKVNKSLHTLGVALVAFVAAYALIQTINVISSRFAKEEQIKSAFGLVGFAVSVGVMAAALKAISKIEGDVWNAFGVLTAVMALITAYQVASALISKIPGTSKLPSTLLGVSLGLLAMIGVIKLINGGKITLEDVNAAKPVLKAITIILFGIEALMGRAAKMGGGNKLASSTLSVALGILAMIGLVKLVNTIVLGDVLGAGIVLVGMGAILGITSMLFGKAAQLGGGAKAPASILSITLALGAMVGLVHLLNTFTLDELFKGEMVLITLGLLIVAIQKFTAEAANISKGQKLAPVLLSTTIAMGAMVGLISVLRGFTSDEINHGLWAITKMAAIIVATQLLTALAAKLGDGKGMAVSIGAIVLSLIALTGALALLSMIDAPSLTAASNAMLMGAGALVGLILAIGAFSAIAPDSTGKMLGLGASLILFGIGLAAMSIPLILLANIPFDNLMTGAGVLVALMLAVGIMGTSLQAQLPTMLLLGPVLMLVAAGLAALTIPLQILCGMDTENLIQGGIALGVLVGIIELLGFTGTAMLPGLTAAAIGIAEVGAALIPLAAAVDMFGLAVTLMGEGINLAGEGFKKGAEAIDILVGAFEKLLTIVQNNRDTFVEDCKIMGEGVGEGIYAGIEGFFGNIGEKLSEIWGGIITSFKNFFGIHSPSTVMSGLAGNLATGLVEGIQNGIKNVVGAITNLGKKMIDGIGGFVSSAVEKGKEFVNGFANGVKNFASKAVDAVKGFGQKVKDGVTGAVSTAVETGKNFVNGFSNGVKKTASIAVNAAANLATQAYTGVKDFLGIHSPSTLLEEIGKFFSEGFGDGITSLKDWVGKKAEELGIDTSNLTLEGAKDSLSGGSGMLTDGITALLDKLTGKITPSAEELGLGLGDSTNSSFQAALTDATTGLGGTNTQQKVKTELEKLQDYIDEENYYGRMSLQEELDAYLAVQDKYTEGSADRKKVDREVYRLTKKIYESQLEYIEAVGKAQEDAADERLKLEEEYYKNVADAEESANRKRLDAQEQYANESRSINERLLSDIALEQQKYEDAVKSRTESIASSYELFGKPDKARKVSGEKLIDYLNSQNTMLKDWRDQLDALEQRGIKGALLEELQSMGPSKTGELKGLLALTDEQLTEYANLFEDKNELARDRATQELEGLKADTDKAIKDLTATAKSDLSDLKNTYNNTMSEINRELSIKLKELNDNFDEGQEKINTELETKLTELKEKYTTTMEEIDALSLEELTKLIEENNVKLEQLNKDTELQLVDLEKTYDKSGDKIVTGFDKNLKQLPIKARTNTTRAIQEVKSLEPEWYKTGVNSAMGFGDGLEDTTWYAVMKARALAQAAIAAANAALAIRSPSKVFFDMGAFVSKGFANGIDKYTELAEQSAEAMADSVISIVGDSLRNIEALNDDFSPVITPIIDLSNVNTGASKINALLGRPYSVGATSRKQATWLPNNQVDNLGRLIESIEGSTIAAQTSKEASSIQFTQNNYSPKALSRLDIYRQTRNQISTLKGLIRV